MREAMSMSSTSDRLPDDMEWDPVFLHAKRETAVIIGLCLAFLVYTMIVCGWLGYDRSPTETAQVGQVFGIPTWAF